MSVRLTVIEAVAAMVRGALPSADVLGLDDNVSAPGRLLPGGRVVVRSGAPGAPEIDLSPRRYNYSHRIPVEIDAASEAQLDAMVVAIGEAIETDRTLGGVVEWVDGEAPETEDIEIDAAKAPRGTELILVAMYATANPLT